MTMTDKSRMSPPDKMAQRPWSAFNGSIEMAPVVLDMLIKLQLQTERRYTWREMLAALLVYCAERGDDEAMLGYITLYA